MTNQHAWVCLGIVLALGCGGATEAQPTTTAQRSNPEPAEAAPEPQPEPQPEPEPEEEADVAPAPAPEPAPPEPVVAEDADAIFEVLRTATFEADMLRRLVDPDRGVGTHDAGRTGVAQHCDVDEVADRPGTSFAVNEGDTFRCDRDLSRCTAEAPDGGGYSFYFRNEGRLYLDAIVHHAGRVPRTDSRAVRSWVEAGEGVCAIWRAAHATDRPAPAKFSVFISEQTGLVAELVSDHHCGDDARAAFGEQMANHTGQALSCDRGPARCSFRRGDEEITLYGGEEGLTAIAITRPGMFANLERAQRRDLDRFLRALRDHECE